MPAINHNVKNNRVKFLECGNTLAT